MTKQLKWRLGKLPTPDEVLKLVNDKLITKEEARDILFNEQEERDTDSLKEEIKFLRELVSKLSNGQNTKIIETIKEVQKPYYHWNWYPAYNTYCISDTALTTTNGTTYLSTNCSGTTSTNGTTALSFTDIQTF